MKTHFAFVQINDLKNRGKFLLSKINHNERKQQISSIRKKVKFIYLFSSEEKQTLFEQENCRRILTIKVFLSKQLWFVCFFTVKINDENEICDDHFNKSFRFWQIQLIKNINGQFQFSIQQGSGIFQSEKKTVAENKKFLNTTIFKIKKSCEQND